MFSNEIRRVGPCTRLYVLETSKRKERDILFKNLSCPSYEITKIWGSRVRQIRVLPYGTRKTLLLTIHGFHLTCFLGQLFLGVLSYVVFALILRHFYRCKCNTYGHVVNGGGGGHHKITREPSWRIPRSVNTHAGLGQRKAHLNSMLSAPAHFGQHAPGGVTPMHPCRGSSGQRTGQSGRPSRPIIPDDVHGPA